MFSTIQSLKNCINKHNKSIWKSKLSESLVDVLVDHYVGNVSETEISKRFVEALTAYNNYGIEYFKENAQFDGAKGVVFVEESLAVKLYKSSNNTLNVKYDNDTIIMFVDEILNYVLIKSILLEAWACKITDEDLSVYFSDMEELFCIKDRVSRYYEEEDEFRNEDILQLGYTSKYLQTNWSNVDAYTTKKVTKKIFSIVGKLDKLSQEAGVTICHGDLKFDSILLDDMTPRIIDLGFSSVLVNFTFKSTGYLMTRGNNCTSNKVTNYRYIDACLFAFNHNWTFKYKKDLSTNNVEILNLFRGLFDDETFNEISEICKYCDETNDTQYKIIFGPIISYFNENQGYDFERLCTILECGLE